MKRLILGGLSVLLVCAATAPAKASGKEEGEGSNKRACQSIPRPSPSGEAYLARRQAIQRCDTEVRSRLTMNLCKSGQPLNTPLADRGKQLFR